MDGIFVLKGQLQQMYVKHSKLIDKGVQFVLALLVFFTLNKEMGYLSMGYAC